ncbi:hypothetical protein [Sphingomonas crocodyli]|uniref:Uncharacterized protein n=1 Tax=Sphingomonas crocodyli TaxID=1979270 RepID=A0A437LYG4_9SPHN|nr:hypothetical protein [Sphingomonas crocodyli]RVT90468.1 hypothetical protein EOD43_19650 [Sphingomonas crocodyli]
MRHDPLCPGHNPTSAAGIPWSVVDAYRHDLSTWQPFIEAHGWRPITAWDGGSPALVRSPLRWIFGVAVDDVWHDMRGGGLDPLPDFHPTEFVPVTYEQGEAIFLHVPDARSAALAVMQPCESPSLFEVMMGMTAEAWDASTTREDSSDDE